MAEARIYAARRHRPRMAMRHDAGGLRSAGAFRRLLHRRGQREEDAGDDPPRHVRLAGALYRHIDRALRRPSAAVAVAAADRRLHHHARRRRLRDGGGGGGARLGLAVDLDLRNEKITYKVREHSLAKVPALLVVGKKEAAERTVSIRRLGSQAQSSASLADALAALAAEATPPDVKDASSRQRSRAGAALDRFRLSNRGSMGAWSNRAIMNSSPAAAWPAPGWLGLAMPVRQ